jgi:glycosyltransferase involved in cell wall biosynthesis
MAMTGGPLPAATSSTRLRAVVVANRLPYPLDDGWKRRAFHMVEGIATRFDTTLLCFDTSPRHVAAARDALGPQVVLEPVPAPRAYSIPKLVLGTVTEDPVHVWNQRSRAMRSALQALQREGPLHVAVFESSFVYPLQSVLAADCTTVIDCHNVDTVTFQRYASSMGRGPRRWYAALTARKLARFESSAYADADVVWVCSESDRAAARRLAPRDDYVLVPNGVDTTGFRAPAAPAEDRARLVFVGRLDYFPNVDGLRWFVRDVWPVLRSRCPDLELEVVGSGAPSEVAKLVGPHDGIRLLGRVDDVRDVLAAASVVIVPLRVGGGTRLKILEAMSMGCPVVSTTIGAEGLDVVEGRDLVLADDPTDFARSVAVLLNDRVRRESLGIAGRRLVAARYDWKAITQAAVTDLERRCRREP